MIVELALRKGGGAVRTDCCTDTFVLVAVSCGLSDKGVVSFDGSVSKRIIH